MLLAELDLLLLQVLCWQQTLSFMVAADFKFAILDQLGCIASRLLLTHGVLEKSY